MHPVRVAVRWPREIRDFQAVLNKDCAQSVAFCRILIALLGALAMVERELMNLFGSSQQSLN